MRLAGDLRSDRAATRASALSVIESKVNALSAKCEPASIPYIKASADALVDSGILSTAVQCIMDEDASCRESCAGLLLALAGCAQADLDVQVGASLAIPGREDELGSGFSGGGSAAAGLSSVISSSGLLSSEGLLLGVVRCIVDELEMQAAPHDRPQKRCAMACLHFLFGGLRAGVITAQ